MTARETIYRALHGTDQPGLTLTQRILFAAIVASVVHAILGTEPDLGRPDLSLRPSSTSGDLGVRWEQPLAARQSTSR